MKSEDVYQCWKHSHRQVTTNPDFRSHVMDQVVRKAPEYARSLPAFVERITVWPWARAAAITVAAVIGFGRIVLTLHVLLFA